MGLRDRFFTATTARAILSWRLALGVAAGLLTFLVGAHILVAVAAGLTVYAATVFVAMPRAPRPARIDPFTVGEPWRQLVQGGQRSRRRLAEIVAGTPAGPLRDRLDGIVATLDRGLAEGWAAARRGDEVDAMVARLDPTALRSRLGTLRQRAAAAPGEDLNSAITSAEAQIASADRLKELSATTADRLRLTQTRLDEVVAHAAEVAIGTTATDAFSAEVDGLVVELEALRRAVDDVAQVDAPAVDLDVDDGRRPATGSAE